MLGRFLLFHYIVTDEAFHSSTGSGYEQAINDAMMDESEYRARHFSVGTTSAMGPHQSGAARSRAMHSSFHRHPRHASGSEPIPASRPQSSSPAPIQSSSPESRGQRVRPFLFIVFLIVNQLTVRISALLDAETFVVSAGVDG